MSGITKHEKYPFFFYGTLRKGQQNYALLRGRTVSEEAAVVHGMELYALGWYPLMVAGEGMVQGELMTIHSHCYKETVKGIDFLEGHNSQIPQTCLYRRELITVQLTGSAQKVAQDIKAWAYVGSLDCVQGKKPRRIPDGDWSKHQLRLIMGTRFEQYISDQRLS